MSFIDWKVIKTRLRDYLPPNAVRVMKDISRTWFFRCSLNFIRSCLYEFDELFAPKKVSFISVGAQKSGTTALYYFLGEHPDISVSLTKETNYFATESYWENGADYKIYRRQFELFPGARKLGEASPRYMPCHQIAAPRIAEYNPDIKLIFILKNPIDRAYSQYKMHTKANKYFRLTFEECLEIAKSTDSTYNMLDYNGLSVDMAPTIRSYLGNGYYAEQIKTYLALFERNQMLFLRTEELEKEHEKTMSRVFSFLEVKHITEFKRVLFIQTLARI
jgi:Sulfotransferase domain